MSSLKLFEYAVIQQPLKEKGKTVEEGKVLVGVNTVLAEDETQVQLLAAREVPEDAMSDLSRLEVVVRPFDRERVLGILQGQSGARGPSGPVGAVGARGADFTAFSMVPSTSSSTYTSLSNLSSGTPVIQLNT
jgi:hypothetical protein